MEQLPWGVSGCWDEAAGVLCSLLQAALLAQSTLERKQELDLSHALGGGTLCPIW